MQDASQVVRALGMAPHPEGGWYVEIHRSPNRVEPLPRAGAAIARSVGGVDAAAASSRAAMTSIYYLLERGQRSHWHRVDADELWAWHAGAPMEISIATAENGSAGDSGRGRASDRITHAVRAHRLGMDISRGERPQAVVPADAWQSAQPLGDWSLVGCVVAPGFEFAHFEIAPPGWTP